MKFLVLNGPNLNLLGLREPELYGVENYAALEKSIQNAGKAAGVEVTIIQSNHEGVLVDEIQNAYGRFDGIVINAAAYSHTSIAILDALKAVGIATAEVHLTDITAREAFRRRSFVSLYALKTFMGRGFLSYRDAIFFLKNYLSDKAV
ncbi:MAG: 3-dehydroquinate dehydratase [Lachnospiraceae bacterium]|nr:3-dehydroquinate dehydratase [Lachnospiraceae bacterium]